MTILTNTTNGILTLTLNRPEKKNAITADMYQAMADDLRTADSDNTVRVIVITGSEHIFTAGNDLADFMNHAPMLAEQGERSAVVQFMTALSTAQKPVIAAVAGLAVGIGVTMLLHCDLVYLADNAKLSLPFTQLGLCPEFASSYLLPKLIGYPRAAEKLLFGEAFDANEALTMGLANKVMPAADLLSFTHQQAQKLVALPANSLQATKRLMKLNQGSFINDAMREEMRQFLTMLSAPEAKEAFAAFFEKRRANFS